MNGHSDFDRTFKLDHVTILKNHRLLTKRLNITDKVFDLTALDVPSKAN